MVRINQLLSNKVLAYRVSAKLRFTRLRTNYLSSTHALEEFHAIKLSLSGKFFQFYPLQFRSIFVAAVRDVGDWSNELVVANLEDRHEEIR